jgi:hypothetical protein
MPRPDQLPDDLRELAYRNGVELTHTRWGSDLQLLINALRRALGDVPSSPPRPNRGWRTVAVVSLSVILIAAAGTYGYIRYKVGFGSELIKNSPGYKGQERPNTASDSDANFTRLTPIPRSPANGSEFSNFPRTLELVWEEVPGAVAYHVETQIQVEMGQNRVEWVSLPTQQVTTNHCQIEFGGATWGQWRVSATNGMGKQSQVSEWQTFHFTR